MRARAEKRRSKYLDLASWSVFWRFSALVRLKGKDAAAMWACSAAPVLHHVRKAAVAAGP